MENSKIARATHNIAAWRVWDESRGVQLHDNDDDGEYELVGGERRQLLRRKNDV